MEMCTWMKAAGAHAHGGCAPACTVSPSSTRTHVRCLTICLDDSASPPLTNRECEVTPHPAGFPPISTEPAVQQCGCAGKNKFALPRLAYGRFSLTKPMPQRRATPHAHNQQRGRRSDLLA